MQNKIEVLKTHVVITAAGKAEESGFRQLIADLVAHPDIGFGMRVLLDYRGLEEEGSDYSKAEAIAGMMMKSLKDYMPSKMAIVKDFSKQSLTGTLVKSIREYHGLTIETGYFEDPVSALRWLLDPSTDSTTALE